MKLGFGLTPVSDLVYAVDYGRDKVGRRGHWGLGEAERASPGECGELHQQSLDAKPGSLFLQELVVPGRGRTCLQGPLRPCQ